MLNYIKAELWRASRHKGIYVLVLILVALTALFTALMLSAEAFYQMASAAVTTLLLGLLVAPLLTNSNLLKLSFRLPEGVGVELVGDHYYNSASSGKKSFVLFDAGVTYSYKKFRWVLSCSNLLDTRNYVYSVLSAGGSFRTDYAIRPRSFLLKMYMAF